MAFAILKRGRSKGNPSLKWRDFLISTAEIALKCCEKINSTMTKSTLKEKIIPWQRSMQQENPVELAINDPLPFIYIYYVYNIKRFLV